MKRCTLWDSFAEIVRMQLAPGSSSATSITGTLYKRTRLGGIRVIRLILGIVKEPHSPLGRMLQPRLPPLAQIGATFAHIQVRASSARVHLYDAPGFAARRTIRALSRAAFVLAPSRRRRLAGHSGLARHEPSGPSYAAFSSDKLQHAARRDDVTHEGRRRAYNKALGSR